MPQLNILAELWTLGRPGDAIRCVAARHPLGVELRYEMNERPLISRVFPDWDAVTGQARVWYKALTDRGWEERQPGRRLGRMG